MASAVTYEMVEAVCNHLAATGESPTYLKVHQLKNQARSVAGSAERSRSKA